MTQGTLGDAFMAPKQEPNPFASRVQVLGHLLPQIDWQLPNVSELPLWRDAKRVCIDFESCDPQLNTMGPGYRRGDAFVCGVGVAIEDGPSFYLPVRHEIGENLDPALVFRYLRDQLQDYRGEIAGAGLIYDLECARHEGLVFRPEVRFRDALIASPLIDGSHHKYNLDKVLEREGLPGKDETTLRLAAAVAGWGPDE